jgi:guanylate kinase
MASTAALQPVPSGTRARFEQLADAWEHETKFLSNVETIISHPAYVEIIAMGQPAVALILDRLARRRGHWFWALREITGADPVPPTDDGDMVRMSEAWLAWGRQHQYLATTQPLIIVLHGPSGVGKDSVIDRLRERTGIHRATSSTSRKRRADEEDGNHYHFLTRDAFERKIAAGDFLEYALVYGDWKGLERIEVVAPLATGRDVIIRTDVQGARAWREKLEGAIFIFLIAEDREALRARLIGRGSEDEASVARRIAELEEELADEANNDYTVVNHHGRVDEAVAEIEAIIERERANPSRPAARLID